jgi:hypothetical protein
MDRVYEVELEEEVVDYLTQLARRRGITVSEFVSEVLTDWLERIQAIENKLIEEGHFTPLELGAEGS